MLNHYTTTNIIYIRFEIIQSISIFYIKKIFSSFFPVILGGGGNQIEYSKINKVFYLKLK